MRLTDYTTFPDICDKYKKKGDVLKYNEWVDVMASLVYVLHKDWYKSVYWISAATLTYCVTFG